MNPGHPSVVSQATGAAIGISAVERETGVSKDTLRVWERRYGFPRPLRDAVGERAYPPQQVETLRLIKRLLDRGMRPGKLIGRPLEELVRLGGDTALSRPARLARDSALEPYMAMVRGHAVADLRRALSQAVSRHSLAEFVIGTVAPLTQLIGETWMGGQLAVYEEHLYTETVQVVLRGAIAALPAALPQARPLVLLTTFPNEQHGLGLLMVEALLAQEGAHCISLGTSTPLTDIARAAQSHHCDLVGLSFSVGYPATLIVNGLRELGAMLPAGVEIWAGGASAALQRRAPEKIRVITQLDALHAEVQAWRARHGLEALEHATPELVA